MAAVFLCDGMMGHLARWLRLLGEDTEYAGSVLSDDDILARMTPAGPWLVTRDAQLHERALKRGVRSLRILEGTVEDQLSAVLLNSQVGVDRSRWFTRCTHCNGTLEPVQRADVGDRVPPRVHELQKDYRRCARCGQVYWEGTHVEAILRVLEAVGRRVSAQ